MPRIACSDPELATTLRRVLGGCEVLQAPLDCSHAPLCRWLEQLPAGSQVKVEAAIGDAIATLERTRHAFRSRELGQLRQRLEQLLVELSGPAE
ncbi:hypothetical protein [Pseudomonas sp. BMS12]|uniref:hypothetical protein n=1 Tax=Pseudomonas sp. BMS12 TaxID=1796033 RepID=UPI001F424508|nr:hypothetical protein [Pseudomonas sp. BMS12]